MIILAGSSIEGCEKTNSCLNPTSLTILKGDTVNWIREEDTSHFIESRTDSQLNWATMDYSHEFRHAGIFPYTITEMPWIQGVITVEYSQAQNKIPNNIKIVSVEKIGDSLHLGYEGHINTEGGVMMIFTTDTDQSVVNIGIGGDYDGYFSTTLIDRDDYYHEWIDGVYRVEFWSVDGDNKNKKSDIIETTFELKTEPVEDVSKPITSLESSSKIPEWVRNIFIWYAEEQISEDELLNAIQFLLDQGILKSKS